VAIRTAMKINVLKKLFIYQKMIIQLLKRSENKEHVVKKKGIKFEAFILFFLKRSS